MFYRALLTAILVCLEAAHGQVTLPKPDVPTPPRVGVGMTQVKLSLQEAIEMALRNNPDIDIEKTNTALASVQAQGALGFMDPNFRMQSLLESRDTPTGSVLASASGKVSEHFNNQNFYFKQRLPWQGASFHADFENSRQSTNNPFTSLTPFITSRLTVGFSIPLWRDRVTDNERTQLKVKRKQVEQAETDFETRLIDILTRVELAYWDLVAARQDAVVQLDSAQNAREQVFRSQRMIESGTLAPVELSASEAEFERRLDSYYTSLGTITEVENTLKAAITVSHEDPLWGDEVIPTSERTTELPEEAKGDMPTSAELRAAVARAIGKRSELRSLETRKTVNELQKTGAVDQRKPVVNLVANYANNGLAGSVLTTDNPFSASNRVLYDRLNQLSAAQGLPPLTASGFGGGVPGDFVGGYGSTLSNLFSGRYQGFQGGLQIDWTARNRAAEATYAQSVITERRLKLERLRTEQVVEGQVRNALQQIQITRQRIQAAEASAKAAKEKLDSEVRLFQTGESTNFLVLTRQNEYTDSRRRVVVANLDFNRAIARLEQALGTTLDAHKVVLK